MRENLADLSEAVHRCVTTLADLVAGSADTARVAHLTTVEERERARRLIREYRAGRGRPEIDDAGSIERTWHTDLVEFAKPVSGDLAGFLGRAHPAPRDGSPSASQRVEAELRHVDEAALRLARRLDRREFDRAMFGDRPAPVDKVAAELAALGVTP